MFSIRIKSLIKIGYNLQQLKRHFSVDNYPQFGKLVKSKEHKIEINNKYWNHLTRLTTTPEWRQVVQALRNEKINCGRSTLAIYNNLIVNAFWEADDALGWELLNIMNATNFQPNFEAFQAYWNYCSTDRHSFCENIEKMFEFISKNELIVSRVVIDDLSSKIERYGGSSIPVKISNDTGVCENCQHQMQRLQQSALEFHELKREFEKVLVKPNITSVELPIFRQMVNKKKTFDYIVDALNVTRIFPDSKGNLYKQGILLARLVEQLKARNKKVFIVGKKHVERWPEQSINFVRKNATVYLSQSKVAVDDILMMYAALISGQNAHFVTNDLLDEYPNEFSEKGKVFFRNWQKQHQHFVAYDDQTDKIHIQRPNRFICNANKDVDSDRWHLPYTEKPLLHSLKGLVRIPIQWACIRLQNNDRIR